MLSELCKELKNWFETEKRFGEFTIEDGGFSADFLQDGQFFRVVNSVFNDGVWQYPTSDMVDETFQGAVWAMAVPSEVIDLANEIDEWQTKYGGADGSAMSPYQSETFEGYSYTKGSFGSSVSGGSVVADWRDVFAKRLNNWRKI